MSRELVERRNNAELLASICQRVRHSSASAIERDAALRDAAEMLRSFARDAIERLSKGDGGEAFQARVQPWMMECFGAEISADVLERNDRFIEEALELVQANGYGADRAHALVDYVFGRPVGEPVQEVGGVMVTLAALCLAAGLDMHEAGETELARVWTKVEQIRAKQAAKPTGSALPIALSATPPVVDREAEKAVMVCPQCEGEGGYPDGIDEAACHTECARCAGNGWIVNLALLPAVPWQPIETAPHNKPVLLAWADWRDGKWIMDVGPASTGERNAVASSVSHHGSATHWMPLPPSPMKGEDR